MSDPTDNNAILAEVLSQAFAPLVEQLTPEVQPATVFVPSLDDDKDE